MAIKQNLTDFFSVQNFQFQNWSPVLGDHNTGILGSQYWYTSIVHNTGIKKYSSIVF